ncbi:TPA: hypothetical protein SLO04_001897 [Proteus mirabilis]|nr:hypothetical protein [Proteus mirabilis]
MQGTNWTDRKCHFCESEKLEIMQVFHNTFVRCRRCGARGPVAITDESAVTLWLKGGQDATPTNARG